MFLDFHLNNGDKILELVPYVGSITPSCVIKLLTFNRGREAVWYSKGNRRLGARKLQVPEWPMLLSSCVVVDALVFCGLQGFFFPVVK